MKNFLNTELGAQFQAAVQPLSEFAMEIEKKDAMAVTAAINFFAAVETAGIQLPVFDRLPGWALGATSLLVKRMIDTYEKKGADPIELRAVATELLGTIMVVENFEPFLQDSITNVPDEFMEMWESEEFAAFREAMRKYRERLDDLYYKLIDIASKVFTGVIPSELHTDINETVSARTFLEMMPAHGGEDGKGH